VIKGESSNLQDYKSPCPLLSNAPPAMPFDPTIPAPNAEATSAMFRGQFNGLKAMIDAILTVTDAQVDAVNTLPPGEPASVNLSVSGGTLHFTFGLPQGDTGAQGDAGPAGGEGPQGSEGQPGPPFAAAVVDAVNTLPAGSAAAVQVNFDGSNVRFTFGIPQGIEGATGPAGQNGEVTQVDLDNALQNTLAQTSANTNVVSTLDTVFADADMDTLRQKLNELIMNGRR
jgi:hypothetical protein